MQDIEKFKKEIAELKENAQINRARASFRNDRMSPIKNYIYIGSKYVKDFDITNNDD